MKLRDRAQDFLDELDEVLGRSGLRMRADVLLGSFEP